MKNSNLLLALLILFFSVKSFAQEFVWAKSMGSGDNDYGYSIALDDSGNVYTTGWFVGTVDMDPGPNTLNLTSSGENDIFITKLDSSGNLVWAKKIGGDNDDNGVSLTIDGFGNIYITGYFTNTVDFDPGTGIYNLTSAGSEDICILKMDAAGNLKWAKSMGGTLLDRGYFINVDNAGNVYTTGWFNGTSDFDPGPVTYNLSGTNQNAFISKLDSNGNFVWAKNIGNSGLDNAYSVFIDNSAHVFITGNYTGTVDFDPGAGNYYLTSSGSTDAFVLKLDSSGKISWAKSFGGAGNNRSYALAIGTTGNIYLTGLFNGSSDFDPGVGTFYLTGAGGEDVFVLKLNSNGGFLWAKKYGGVGNERGRCIALDAAENVYIGGKFEGNVDFDPNSGTHHLSSASGSLDNFISKLDSLGNFIWAWNFGGSKDEQCNFIYLDSYNNIYTTGGFGGTADFNPDQNTAYNLTSMGGYDIYINKLSQCTNSSSVISAQVCESYISPSGKYQWTVSGTYKDTIQNAAGCDSLITIGLLVHQDTSSVIFRTACDSLISPSGKYKWTVSGTYTDTISTTHGCDSTIIIGLTVNESSSSNISATSCTSYISPSGKYTWSVSGSYIDTISNALGCDSILNITLNIQNDVSITSNDTSCNSFLSPSGKHLWTSSGKYYDTIQVSNACDSTFIVNLTINSVDTSVSVNGNKLSANALGAIYQWVDCNNNYAAISGKTHQSFTASGNGNYAVIVSQFNCTDTSSCHQIINTGITNQNNELEYMIYPNPAKDQLFLQTDENGELDIYLSSGQLVYNSTITEELNLLDISKYNNGLYYLKFTTEKGIGISKLLITK